MEKCKDFDVVSKIVRGVTLMLRSDDATVRGVADFLGEAITKSITDDNHTCGLSELNVLTFAVLRLRDIADAASWLRHTFPEALKYFVADTSGSYQQKYDKHIDALQTNFAQARLSQTGGTVVGSLCDGVTGTSVLLVKVVNNKGLQVVETGEVAKLFICLNTEDDNLSAGEYSKVYSQANTTLSTYMRSVDAAIYAGFVSMLWGLLKHWDVMVVTANNLCFGLDDTQRRRGLSGAVLCFAKGTEAEKFLPHVAGVFAPLLQLLTNAALVESVCHFHARNDRLSTILAQKVRPAMEALEGIRWEIQEAIGGSFGEDLALFHADLLFRRKDDLSLCHRLDLDANEIANAGSSGIFHVEFSPDKLKAVKKWFCETLSTRYPHLADDPDFREQVVSKVQEINDAAGWDTVFGTCGKTGERLDCLWVTASDRKSGRTLLFIPHLEKIKHALQRNFQNTDIKTDTRENALSCTIDLAGNNMSAEKIKEFVQTVNDAKGAYVNLARIRCIPWTWLRLYGGTVEVDWKSNSGRVLAKVDEGKFTIVPNSAASGFAACNTSFLFKSSQ